MSTINGDDSATYLADSLFSVAGLHTAHDLSSTFDCLDGVAP